MSEVAIRQDNGNGHLVPVDDTYERLARWAESAQAAHKVAAQLVQTSFVPEAFRGKPMEATGAILAGAEVGLSPMAALRSFDIINGTAAPRANTLRAVVQSRGHQIRVKESTATRAIVQGCRVGEQHWQESVWTIERATKLGLTGKHNWKAQPQAMLVARATAECARLIASDAILGIPYASEELADGEVVEDAPTPEVRPARRTARRAPLPEPTLAPEPDLDEDAGPALITAAQQRKMHALLREHGKEDRDVGLVYISGVVGREITSTKELTVIEAGDVIDSLELAPEPTLDGGDWPAVPTPGGDGA
jgi:hypothetical protein